MKFLATIVFYSIGYLVSALPRQTQLFLGKWLGWLWFDIFRIRRNVVLSNLRLAFPNKTEAERINIGRKSLECMGQSIIEYFVMVGYRVENRDKYFRYEGLELLNKAYERGQGVLILTMHLGNGDFASVGMASLGMPMNLISKQFKSKWMNELWFDLRRKHGTKFIREEKSQFDILKALKKNEAVIFVLDQFMGPPSGVKTTFFGHETGTAWGLALFQERCEQPVLFAYNYRNPDGTITIVVDSEIPFVKTENREENRVYMTQVYNNAIQRAVEMKPEQWMWIHRRWKKFEVR